MDLLTPVLPAASEKDRELTRIKNDNKFLEVLLHQMPQKLRQRMASTLLPKKQQASLQKNGNRSLFVLPSVGNLTPAWQDQWSFALQVQRSFDSCWQLFKDCGSYAEYSYLESCYRASEDCLERESRGELRIIMQDQAEYPQALLQLRQPPRLLFWQGQLPKLGDEATAIIGSRRADSWGLQQAWQEAVLLQKQYIGRRKFGPAKQDHWIVSGLAQGCDSAAHKGALEAGGRTLAVLPGGFDRIYPKDHKGLAQRIVAEGGALVSEYVPQAAALKWRFVQRDRLQAALARRLLLVQSDLNGGSRHSVKTALEIGRSVYVLDGSETCWRIIPVKQQSLSRYFNGTVSLCKSSDQFSRNKSIMDANHALLSQQLAQVWRNYTRITN